jgi:serine/threonine-protein kinase
MVMELLDGVELARVVRSRGALPIDEAVDLVAAALEGVAEAHKLGIVHRDLKPTNLFLVGGEHRPYSVKVLDFGISKIQPGPDSPVDDELTGTAMLLGSPRYISPEQARSSSRVDVRADIWSMGVILYEVLDGRCPFAGDTIGEVLSKILLHRPEPIQNRRPDATPELAAIIDRCLQRDPDDRFANVAELAHGLERFGSEHAKLHAERIDSILGIERPAQQTEAHVAAGHSADEEASTPRETPLPGALPGAVGGARAQEDSASKHWTEAERAIAHSSDPQGDDDSARGAMADEPTPPGSGTEGNWTQPGSGRSPSRARRALVLGVPAVVVGAVGAWLLLGPPAQPDSPGRVAPQPSSFASSPTPSSEAGVLPPVASETVPPVPMASGDRRTDSDDPEDGGAAAVSSPSGPSPGRPPVPVRPRPPRPKPPATSKGILDQSD